jgi:hypothetical protein
VGGGSKLREREREREREVAVRGIPWQRCVNALPCRLSPCTAAARRR